MERAGQRGAFFRRRAGGRPVPTGPHPGAGTGDVVGDGQRRVRHLPAPWRRILGLSAALATLGITVQSGMALHLPWGPLADVAVGLALGAALLGLGSLLLELLRGLAVVLPGAVGTGVVVATAGALVLLLGFASLPPLLALSLWGLWLLPFLAAGLGIAIGLHPPGTGRSRAVARVVSPTAGVVVGMAMVAWWAWPGPATEIEAPPSPPAVLRMDPGVAGPHTVARFTYGSGAPAWRGDGPPTVTTTPVDLADLVDVGWPARALRPAVLGHGLDAVPRNAVVWHPVGGTGPYPLVLVAHGNANLFTPSALGYAWLGEHLASHGYVVASLDASAFNALPIVGGLRGENDARALLMLAHLQLWGELKGQGHPVAAAVDLDRIALVGHSRGGEAAALAAALDRIGRLPEDALRPLIERVGGPYGIRSVVAIAPSDGQYRPGGRPLELDGVDYLVLQGGHDADVSSFVGERQYERTRLEPGGVKAAIYLHHANHGQFNTEWGRRDLPPPLGPLLHTGALLEGDLQRQAGRVAITAFLEASLRGSDEAWLVVRQPSSAPSWPAAGPVVVRTEEAGSVVVVGFGEDVDPATGTLPGSVVSVEGLAVWREGDVGYRGGVPRQSAAVTVGWRATEAPAGDTSSADAGAAPAYRVRLPGRLLDVAPGGSTAAVRIEIARATQAVGGIPAPRGPLDASVVVVDADGRTASVALSAHGSIPDDMPIRVSRFGPLATARFTPDRYPVFTTIEVPLAAFGEAAPGLDLDSVHTVALVFDRAAEGLLVIRSIALAPGSGAAARQPPHAGGE